MRTVLSRVISSGFVSTLSRQGYVIAPVTLKRVKNLVDARLPLEPTTVRMAVGSVDVAKLRAMDARYRTHFGLE